MVERLRYGCVQGLKVVEGVQDVLSCLHVHGSICAPYTKTCKVLIASLGIAQHLTYSLCDVPLFPHTNNCCFPWQERNSGKLNSMCFFSFWEILPFSAICDKVSTFSSLHYSHKTVERHGFPWRKNIPKRLQQHSMKPLKWGQQDLDTVKE